MTDLLINISGGLINSERQARVVLVVIAVAAAGLAVFILLTQSKTFIKKGPPKDIEFLSGQEEYYRTVQPFD